MEKIRRVTAGCTPGIDCPPREWKVSALEEAGGCAPRAPVLPISSLDARSGAPHRWWHWQQHAHVSAVTKALASPLCCRQPQREDLAFVRLPGTLKCNASFSMMWGVPAIQQSMLPLPHSWYARSHGLTEVTGHQAFRPFRPQRFCTRAALETKPSKRTTSGERGGDVSEGSGTC